MAARGHIRVDELTPADVATLDENWSAANAALDQLLGLTRDHRCAGCAVWYCSDVETSDLFDSYELHQTQMILRVAIERLTVIEVS